MILKLIELNNLQILNGSAIWILMLDNLIWVLPWFKLLSCSLQVLRKAPFSLFSLMDSIMEDVLINLNLNDEELQFIEAWGLKGAGAGLWFTSRGKNPDE